MLPEVIHHPVSNYGNRYGHISGVVLHCTAKGNATSWPNALRGTLNWWNDPKSEASAHAVIDRDGTIIETVPDELVAWHAGITTASLPRPEWIPEDVDPNQVTLGLELLGDVDDYTGKQLESAVLWLRCKAAKHFYPVTNLCAHSDLYNQRSDPGPQCMAEIRRRLNG